MYISYYPFGEAGKEYPIYVMTNDTSPSLTWLNPVSSLPDFPIAIPDDACDTHPYPSTTPDLSGYVTIVRRGTCTFVSLFHLKCLAIC